MENHKIVSYIRKALRADCYEDFSIELQGKPKKTEGYASDMVFAKIRLADSDKKIQEYHLAIKFSKASMRKFEVFRNVYKNELLFYKEIMEVFNDHQNKQNVSKPFKAVAKCHATFSDEDVDIIFLDNLYQQGYILHDRHISMNMNHLKLLMKTYAKFHAISLSLKEQQNESFLKILENDLITKKTVDFGMSDFFNACVVKVSKHLREGNRLDLSTKFDKLMEKGISEIISDIIVKENPELSVMVHCDCHNNNFMFKYKDNNRENLLDMAIVDWQIVRYHSPVIDLAYILYSIASKPEINESTALLKYYHEELTTFFTELGNDANSVFPYSVLMDHWRKYALYGFAHACCFMDFNFVKPDDAPSLDNLDDMSSVSENLSVINLGNNQMYMDRLIAIVEHYFNNINA
ncbi:uncharacterized protein LOC114349347 isoform X3 [Diabrotica virgifera virgifera]|uniref:Uncharacterized protein LOC114349348 isoform X1 n=1 Tax=Diabrotica virgifera virgifera TaxID=50390 RepID=A0A6P7HCZ8_DIAVI|nr:uncharacterized protein LOC114349347 isoform X3 [Diabrotica virgifera virgifera]